MATPRTRAIEIDPMFHVPPGVVDVRQENKLDGQYNYDVSTVAQEGPTLLTPESTIPMPPTSYSIVDQAVRVLPDGRSVVDVTVEFPDLVGVNNIDVSVTVP